MKKKFSKLGMIGLLILVIMLTACSQGAKPEQKPGRIPLGTEHGLKILQPNHETYEPTEQIKEYYAKWKDGNHYDASGKLREKPGYVQAFELPEAHLLPWEKKASKMGAVVVMVPNGTADELPGEYCVSTDEAMGYGLILAALMDDKQLFDDLYRVVDYYDNYNAEREKVNGNGWEDALSSWAIPAKKGQDWFKRDEFKALKPSAQAQWRSDGVQYEPLYKDNTKRKESVILGEPRSIENASGSAMDGEIDIAYALYLAHSQWGSQENTQYVDQARNRFDAIFTHMIEVYGILSPGEAKWTSFLPTGDYAVNYRDRQVEVKRALTRPCDWMIGQFRTYYEDTKDPRAKELIEVLYEQTSQLANQETGFVPDFAKWILNEESGELELVAAESLVANEWMSDKFYMNSSRFMFRQVIDTVHYQEEEGLNHAKKILDFMIATYGFTEESDFENYPPAIHELDGKAHEEGLWTNAVLNAGLYATASASNDSSYQEFVNRGWDHLVSNFDSRYYDWDENGLGYDPSHSGYFVDTWRLMSMLMMSGNWFVPDLN